VQLPPLWLRWVLAIAVAVALIAGLVIAIDRAGPEDAASEAGAEAEANRVADIAIAEDEAPHLAGLPPGSAQLTALEQAVASDVRRRIAIAQLTGPLESVTCTVAGTDTAGRVPYRCNVRSAGIVYPFLAVADERRRRLTWCKVDQPPLAKAGPELTISASCRA